MSMVDLTEAQMIAAEMLANGETQMNTAKMVNVNVKTVSRWLKDERFKAELERNVRLLKSKVDESISRNIEPIMKRLLEIALKSDSEKTSLDACIYAINRIVGTPTNKTQDVTDNVGKSADISIDDMLKEIKEDNVIPIAK